MTIRSYNDKRAFELSYFSENDVLVYDRDVWVALHQGLFDPYHMIYINQLKTRDAALRKLSNITGSQVLSALREEAFLLGMQRGELYDSLILSVNALYKPRFPDAQSKVRDFYRSNGFNITTVQDNRFREQVFEYGISPLPQVWDSCWGDMKESVARYEDLLTPLDLLSINQYYGSINS
jgi:hypothetical protein